MTPQDIAEVMGMQLQTPNAMFCLLKLNNYTLGFITIIII